MRYKEIVLDWHERCPGFAHLFKVMPRAKPIYIITFFMILIVVSGCARRIQPETPKEELSQERSAMDPKIIKRDHFKVTGTLTRIDPQNDKTETYVSIWNQFESYQDQIRPNSIDQAYYGVSLNTDKKGVFDYLAGMAVSNENAVPEVLAVREIPAADYAVFECPIQKIAETKQFIFQKWLPVSKYELNAANPGFEQYPPADDTTSPVLIHIPIKEKVASN
jgi:predicted transcriptional regulator YdeE